MLPSGINIDLSAFARKLVGNRELMRIYYYTAVVRREDGEQRFLERLNHLDYFQVKRGNTVIEKGVDVNIAVDMLGYAQDQRWQVGQAGCVEKRTGATGGGKWLLKTTSERKNSLI